jgi:hypothetical protein
MRVDMMRPEYDGYTLTDDDRSSVALAVGEVKELMTQTADTLYPEFEFRVDLSDYGIGGGLQGNRIDVMAYNKEVLLLADYKFGVTYVDPPKYNLQLKAYALGAMKHLGGERRVVAAIIQPEAETVCESYAYTPTELKEADELIRAVILATKDPDAPLNRGHHCGFCHARPTCPAWRELVLNIPKNMHIVSYMSKLAPDERTQLYEDVIAACSWFKDAEAAVKGFVLAGGEVPGYIVGEGKSKREWKNEASAMLALYEYARLNDLSNAKLTKLVSPAQAKKALGKAAKDEIAKHVEVVSGNPDIVKNKM